MVNDGLYLGPLLFNIFINDIFLFVANSELNLYADDSILHFSGSQVKDVNTNLNKDVGHITEWCLNNNNMIINTKKSCSMLMSTAQKLAHQDMNRLCIKINDKVLPHVSNHKFLGIVVDERLSWSKHIDSLVSKISLRLRTLYRVKKFLPFSARLTYYYSFIGSHLDYCSTVWGGASACEIKRLTLMQKNVLEWFRSQNINNNSH